MTSNKLNGEIAAVKLARSSSGALDAALELGELPVCPYPRHRGTDWHLVDGPVVCGVCHPPVIASDLVIRLQVYSTWG